MFRKILILSAVSLLSVACDSQKKDARSFETVLEAETGQAHSIAKTHTKIGDYTVYKNEVTGEYVAYNLKKWDRETMTTYAQFMANGTVPERDIIHNLTQVTVWENSGHYEFYDDFCKCTSSMPTSSDRFGTYVDTSGWRTYYDGSGYRFENTSSGSKDLDTLASLGEEAMHTIVKETLQSQYSLSSNRAEELAKLAAKYQRLESKRELTTGEKDRFAMEALGVSMTQVESAMQQKAEGNESQFAALLEKAAKKNNTTPEQIGKFFEEMI